MINKPAVEKFYIIWYNYASAWQIPNSEAQRSFIMHLSLTNAKLTLIWTWRNFSISKMSFQEGHEEHHAYPNRRRLGLIGSNFLSKKKVTMTWTGIFGREKTRTFGYCGGLMLSW